MGKRSRQSILKRVRELKRKEKAAQKRERRLARKQGKDSSAHPESEESQPSAASDPLAVERP